MGSRSLQTAGSAIHLASNAVLDRAKSIAAHMLEASPDDIVAGDGGVHVAGTPSKGLSWVELAAASRDAPVVVVQASEDRDADDAASSWRP